MKGNGLRIPKVKVYKIGSAKGLSIWYLRTSHVQQDFTGDTIIIPYLYHYTFIKDTSKKFYGLQKEYFPQEYNIGSVPK